MPNTHIFKSCIVGVSQLSTFVESFRLLRITGLLGILLISNNVLAQSESIEPLPSTVPTATEQDERIVEVRIEGNETVEISKLPQLNTRAGQIFDPGAIEEDVRTLHRTRKFIDVLPKYVRVRQGVVVVFTVVERPTLRYVKFVGNQRVTTRTLRKKAEIDVGDSIDTYGVEEARRKLESYYLEKGYDTARVTTVEGTKSSDKGAVFLIDEGRSRKSFWTTFVGNSIASDARLLTQIKSKPGFFWFLGGDVDHEKIDSDVDTLTAYYRSLGFFQARVGREVQVIHGLGRDWALLTFVINEGPRYRVRNVSFLGNSRFKGEFLERDLKLKSGEFFHQGNMDTDLGLIRDIYGGRGFVFADIQADPRFLEEPGELDLVYKVAEGQRYRVGQINVRIGGENPHTRHSVILNRLSLRPGDILDIRKLRADERRIASSGLFLNEPARGEGPRIVFSKPDPSRELIARDPTQKGFRGQSPDKEEAVLDLVLHGTLAPSPTEQESAKNDQEFVKEDKDPTPSVHGSEQPQWRGQSPAYGYQPPATTTPATATSPPPYRQSFGQPNPNTTQPYVPAPSTAQSPNAAAWGGSAIGATSPGAIDYGRIPPANTAPTNTAPTQRVTQQPVAQPQTITAAPATAPSGYAQSGFGQPGFSDPSGFNPLPNVPGMSQPGVPQQGFNQPPLQPFPANEPYVIVDVNAEETQTGRLMIGAGVNSNAGLVGNIVVDEQNFDITRLPTSWDDIRNGTAFRGAGQRFRLEAAPGTELQRYTATFQEPYLFDTRVGLSTSASYFTRYFYDWAEGRVGGRVGLGYQFVFAPDFSVNTGFRGESVDIFNPRVQGIPDIQGNLNTGGTNPGMVGTNSVYGFSGGLIHDTRDSPFLPTEGHLATVEFEQVIGTFIYPRGVFEARQYFLLNQRPDGSGRHVLSLGTILGFSGPDTPAYDNFYAGGYNTLRGFVFRGASPRQSNANGQEAIVGGPFEWLNTVEYMFPITADDSLRGVVFTDFGTVESNVTIKDFRVAPGFGLRITMPALGPAPIALDFAVPVSYADFDSQQLFSFFVGFAR
jgi:outer membrane protein insertion porin family